MYSQVSNHSSEGESSPSHDTMESLVGMVEASLLARLEGEEASLDRISVQVLGLNERAFKRLRKANISTIQQLVNCAESDLLSIDGLGPITVEDIKNKLNSYLMNMLGRGAWESDTTRINEEMVEASLLESLEHQGAPLDKISVQLLGLTEQESNELRMFNINTIRELVNCARSGFLSIPNLEITTVAEIKRKLNSYLSGRLSQGDWESDTTSSELKPRSTLPTLDEAFNELFGTMKNRRESTIFRLRYGLDDGIPRTLEKVGQEFGLTRERIRQIENRILNRIRRPTIRHIVDDIVRPFESALQQAGGILKENQMCEKICEVTILGEINPIGATHFVLQVTSRLKEIGDGIWALEECPHEHFPSVTAAAALRLEENHSRMRYNQLVSEVRTILDSSNSIEERKIDTLFIEACLEADSQFEISHDGWCALVKWQSSYIDEMIEVLRDKGTALHFREIASGAKALLNGNQEVSEHSIHNALQRRQDIFVWVGQGSYGLVEWGIQRPIYYIDLITNILEVEGKPLPAEEIIRRVEESRPCKHASIMMYLTLNDRFAKFARGIYGLRKWISIESGDTNELQDPFIDELRRRLAISLSKNKQEQKGSIEPVVADQQDGQAVNFPITVDTEEIQEMGSISKSERTQGILRILREMPPSKHKMVDIIEWLMEKGRHNELKHVILSDTPSTAPHTLHEGTDVCVSCIQERKCCDVLRSRSREERIELLLQYRNELSKTLLTDIKMASGDELHNLLNQLMLAPIHIKFGAAYALVVEAKTQLLRERLITSTCSVLRKDHGRYCPYNDIWELRYDK